MIDRLTRESLMSMTGGFIAWSAYFVAAYAFLSAGCVARLDQTFIALALAALTVATLGAIAYVAWRGLEAWRAEAARESDALDPARRRFMALIAVLCAGLALIATVWVAAPMLFLPPCA